MFFCPLSNGCNRCDPMYARDGAGHFVRMPEPKGTGKGEKGGEYLPLICRHNDIYIFKDSAYWDWEHGCEATGPDISVSFTFRKRREQQNPNNCLDKLD